MRNRRLLTLAVLAVAIGFSAYAQAADNTNPYGIAVLTVTKDPNVLNPNNGTYAISIRLWDAAGGIGSIAQTPGVLDYAIRNIAGTGLVTVTSAVSVAPYGEVMTGVPLDANVYGGGFSYLEDPKTNKPVGISYAGQSRDPNHVRIPNSFNAVGMQPVAYDSNTPGLNRPIRDAAILFGVGTTGRASGLTTTQNGVGTWTADPAPTGGMAGDTLVVMGQYTATGAGTINATTWGVQSFDVLRGDPNVAAPLGYDVFVGPAVDANTFGRPVKAVVVITTSSGNLNPLDGGKIAATVPTTFEVQAGNVVLGTGVNLGTAASVGTPAVANTTLILNAGLSETDPNVSITLGANQIIAGLQMTTANIGNQALDLKSPGDSGAFHSLSVYSGDTAAADLASVTELAIMGLIQTGIDSTGTEGLFDSSMSLHPDSAIGVTDQTLDDNGDPYILVRSTIMGDANLDGFCEFADLQIVTSAANYGLSDYMTWDRGDFNRDGFCEFADLQIVTSAAYYGVAYTPEPASMLLLAVGAVGVLARRRRK